LPVDDVTLALTLFATAVAVAILLAFPVKEGTISPVSWLRARDLFLSKLNSSERRHWAHDRRLTIVGSSGRQYTMTPYEAFNIRAGKDVYCLRVLGPIPAYDKLLAQRLLVEADEQTFLATANKRTLAH
jgi:hypothetical protein